MIKLVLIDFDGTLSLTEEACFYIENRLAEEMGLAPVTRVLHKKSWGKPLRDAILERFPTCDLDLFIERLHHEIPLLAARGEMDTISDQNIATLDTIKAMGKNLALLTARRVFEVEHLMAEKHPLNHRMERFYHKDNLEHMKPDPKVFIKPLADFHVQPNEAVYVGDTLLDAAAAKGAGLHFIALLEEGIRTKEDFAEFPVDFFANKFADIVEYIQSH